MIRNFKHEEVPVDEGALASERRRRSLNHNNRQRAEGVRWMVWKLRQAVRDDPPTAVKQRAAVDEMIASLSQYADRVEAGEAA